MNTNTILLAAVIALGVLVILLFIVIARLSRDCSRLEKERDEQKYRYDYEMHKAEIISLQSQINPHFLYNTLEVIRSEALINRDPVAAQMAEALANYFRYNISLRSDVVSLGAELDNVNNYITIQKKRFGERVNYDVVYHSDRTEARGAQIPKLSLQPLVENAIYHGIEVKAKGGLVLVHVTVTDQRVIITVADDGAGMKPETLEELNRHIREDIPIKKEDDKHGGIALMNVNKRIRMMYGEEYGLSFSSVERVGTEAEITLPYIAG